MNASVLAAVITATSSFLTAIGTLSLTRWTENRLFKPLGDRRRALRGTWRGNLTQNTVPPDVLIKDIEMICDPGRRRIKGTWFTHIQIGRDEMTLQYSLIGGFYHDRFLKFDFRNDSPGKIQFGAAVLELTGDARTLSGAFVAYGPMSNAIIQGSMKFSRND